VRRSSFQRILSSCTSRSEPDIYQGRNWHRESPGLWLVREFLKKRLIKQVPDTSQETQPNSPNKRCRRSPVVLTPVKVAGMNDEGKVANPPMNPKTSPQMTAVLLILGGSVFSVLGVLHATYTLLDIRYPRRLVPVDPSVTQAMANSALRLSRGRTDMWRAWIGFNFSHSLGVLLGWVR